MKNIDLKRIVMLVTDVDGVLTDGRIILHSDGTESKTYSLQDGHGIKMWQRAGLGMAWISGRSSAATLRRAEQLGVKNVIEGVTAKLPAFEELMKNHGLEPEQIAYLGDDLLDLPLVVRAGLGVAVANAVDELKASAAYVTRKSGGDGAVREVIEYILKGSGRWDDLMQRYLV